MSDHIPFEVQEEIIKRLPVKSLIQFRSVSKTWKSLIDSPQFISAHSVLHAHSHRLLVWHEASRTRYFSIPDDDTFLHQKFALPVPSSIEPLSLLQVVVGCCHGLFCFTGCHIYPGEKLMMVVIWNPSIRKTAAIALPNVSNPFETVIGFLVCPVSSDPKILLFSKCKGPGFVVTLSSVGCRSTAINLTFELPKMDFPQAVVDGFIYWVVSDKISIDGGDQTCNLIMSFDLANNEFKKVYLPDCLAVNNSVIRLSICKLKDSLAVIALFNGSQHCEVWMMEDGVPNLFLKLFTIYVPDDDLCISNFHCFRNNCKPIIELMAQLPNCFPDKDLCKLAVYNPYSKHFIYPWVFNGVFVFFAYSYTETLLLQDHKHFGYSLYIDEDEMMITSNV